MSKLDDLRAKVEAMTPGEWVHGGWQYEFGSGALRWTEIAPDKSRDDDARITVAGSDPLGWDGCVITGCGCCGSPSGRQEDATGIVALRNAAPALLDLAEAVDAFLAANDAQLPGDRYYIPRAHAVEKLRAARKRLEDLP